MRSGRPPAPWRGRQKRAPSVARIGALSLVLAAVAAFALYRLRPLPLPWHAVGSERIVTPAFDIADEPARVALWRLSGDGLNTRGRAWLGIDCDRDILGTADEVYVLTHNGMGYRPSPQIPYRVVVRLSGGGEVTYERFGHGYDALPVERRSRTFDAADAERFRSLLLDGGYADMEPLGPMRTHSPTLTLESCVQGRYYGVVRTGEPEAGPLLSPLAEGIKAFALEGNPVFTPVH